MNKFIEFNVGDLIFTANSDSAPMIEHLIKIETIDHSTGIIKIKCALSINKMMNNDGTMSYIPIPFFGLLSNQSNIIGADREIIYINLNKFDIIGKVTNNEIKELFFKTTSNLVISAEKNKSVLVGV